MNKITYADKVAINENTEIPDINKVTDSDMNEIKNVVNDFISGGDYLTNTPTLMDATMTYSTQYGKYKYINDSTVVGTVVLRGNITAISSPAYARIKFNIPGVTSSNLQGWESFGIIQEALGCTDETPYCAIVGANGEDITIGLQKNVGTASANWVVANNIYIRVAYIINIAN